MKHAGVDEFSLFKFQHLWAREFWYLFLRNDELIKTVYDSLLPLHWDENATDEDKSKMEMGEELVSIVSYILWFPP